MPKSLRQKQLTYVAMAFIVSVIFGMAGGLVRNLSDFASWTISFAVVAAIGLAIFWLVQNQMRGKS